MPQYLITIFRSQGFDPARSVDAAMSQAIDVLNQEMIDAGIRIYVGGLMPPATARSIRREDDGTITPATGTYLATNEYIDGLWVIEAADADVAEAWGRKAALACRASVEVRPFYS